MTDTKLSALSTGTLAEYTYGIESGASRKYHGGNTINVKDYGAVGDGATDDGAALQAAITAVTSNAEPNQYLNKKIYFPAGSYLTSIPLRFTHVGEVDVFGDGFQHTFIGPHPSYAYSGNTFSLTPAVSCLFEFDGFHNSKVRDLSLYWGSGSNAPNNTAGIYAYGGNYRCDTVDIHNVYFSGASYGIVIGGGPLVSEWHYQRAKFKDNGQAAVLITGQNSLNHTFYGCSFDSNGLYPLLSTCTGSISGTVLTVTVFTAGTSNTPLSRGLTVFDATGVVKGNCTITETHAENGAMTGTGGTGTYTVSVSHAATGPLTILAINANTGQLVNLSGSATIVSGCDFTAGSNDIVDYGANSLVVSGIRTESPNFAIIGSGTQGTFNGCFMPVNVTNTCTATTTGPILTVTGGISGQGLIAGMYVYGTDGVTSLPETGLSPAITKILYQISGTRSSTGAYLLNQSPTANLGSFTCHLIPVFLDVVGGSAALLNECGGTGAVITGSNNAQVRIRNNLFGASGFLTTDLLRGFAGRVLEYDVSAMVGVGNETFANLPTANARFKGCRMYIIDSSVTTFGSNAAAGGSTTVPVYCDGTNWKVG